MAFWIILSGFWLSPLISFLFFSLTENRKKIRLHTLYISFLLSFLTLIGLLTHISTTSSFFDWLMLSNIYLTISLTLWWTQFQYNKYFKIIGLVTMIFVFGSGYTFSVMNFVVIGLIVNDYDTDSEKWFEKGIIYKETSFGNVIARVRGRRVEIYKTLSWLPILEWPIQKKEYLGYYFNNFSVDYKPNDGKIYLSFSSENFEKSSESSNVNTKKQEVYFDSIDIR